MSEHDTKSRILDAAEELFAEEGFNASLRKITSRAQVNLASIHYHFGSKDELIYALFKRRIDPMNKERERLLADVDLTSADALEQVIRAFLKPAIDRRYNPAHAADHFMRAVGRLYAEDSEFFAMRVKPHFEEVFLRFLEVFQQVCPHLGPVDVFWRMRFMIGAMTNVLLQQPHFNLPGPLSDLQDNSEHVLSQIVAHTAGGLRAPSAFGSPGAKTHAT